MISSLNSILKYWGDPTATMIVFQSFKGYDSLSKRVIYDVYSRELRRYTSFFFERKLFPARSKEDKTVSYLRQMSLLLPTNSLICRTSSLLWGPLKMMEKSFMSTFKRSLLAKTLMDI